MPVHELVQAAVFANYLCARSKHQVKRIAENDIGAIARHLFGRHTSDRPVGTNRHERWRTNVAATKYQRRATRSPALVMHLEFHASLSGVTNIASP